MRYVQKLYQISTNDNLSPYQKDLEDYSDDTKSF